MVHAAEKLLDDFRALPGSVERPRTFMEIAGYPHYENVCSNILAFFMDPEEAHGLKTLVLDALAIAGNIAAAGEGVGGNVSVEREVITNDGNRIDILIESDDRVVLIENKIYASVNNPFADYTDYLDQRVRDDRAKHKLLLTVFPTSEGRAWNFANLTYADLVGELRSLLGRYVSDADARYLMMFLDFLNTLEILRRGTRMDKEFVEFLAKRGDDVRSLFNDLKSFRTEMRSKVQELESLLSLENENIEAHDAWRGDTVSMSDNLYQTIRVAVDLTVGIDTNVSPSGWEIRIFPRPEREPHYSKLRDTLHRLGIEFEQGQGWRRLIVHPEHFAYNANLDQIRPVLQELIDKLATAKDARSDLAPA